MKELLKWPLIVAAVVVILRVVVERAGAAGNVSNFFSVVALHLLIGPLYFAVRIAMSGMRRPYLALIKLVGIYVVLTRAMVIPTYWLARIYGWQQDRFYGLSGPDVSPLHGYFTIPFETAAMWIVVSLVVGSALGSIVIAVMSRFFRAESYSS